MKKMRNVYDTLPFYCRPATYDVYGRVIQQESKQLVDFAVFKKTADEKLMLKIAKLESKKHGNT